MGLNDSLAHSNMARIYYRMTDYKLAAQTLEKASKLGDAGADAMLGNMYLNGIHFKKDYKKRSSTSKKPLPMTILRL